MIINEKWGLLIFSMILTLFHQIVGSQGMLHVRAYYISIWETEWKKQYNKITVFYFELYYHENSKCKLYRVDFDYS